MDMHKIQLEVFKTFMDDVIIKDRERFPKKSFGEYTEGEFRSLSSKVLEKEEVELKGFSPSTLKKYAHLYQEKKGVKFSYQKNKMDALAHFIDHESFESYVEEVKEKMGYGDYDTSALIYYRIIEDTLDKEALSYEKLSVLGEDQQNNQIQYFTDKIKRGNGMDDHAYFWSGILFLQRKQYATALALFKKSIAVDPTNEEYYYNLALAKFKGKRPFRLALHEIRDILDDLNVAIQLNSKQVKFYCLKKLIREDYFLRRGLSIPKEASETSIEGKLENNDIELDRLKRTLNLASYSFR